MCDHWTDSYGIYLFFLEYKYVVFKRYIFSLKIPDFSITSFLIHLLLILIQLYIDCTRM